MSRFKDRNIFIVTAFAVLGLFGSFLADQNILVFIFLCFVGLLLMWWLSYYLEFGWYILVFLSPYIQIVLNLHFLRFYFPNWPWLFNANAPIVEFWTIALLIAWLFNILRRYDNNKLESILAPGLGLFVLFVLSALISLVNAPNILEVLTGVKYLLHFILLFYLGYVILGANIVKEKKVWLNSLRLLMLNGFLAALMGAVSLWLGVFSREGFHRAVPFSVFGLWPFGDQHIFLAEIITVAVPIFLYFWQTTKDIIWKNIYLYGGIFVMLIGLLTLSRAGWFTLVLEIFILFFLTRKEINWKEMLKKIWPVLIVGVILTVYFFSFITTTYTVKSSTDARWYTTDIALFFFIRHPFLGNGVGSFVPMISEVRVFNIEFGDPTDALGVVQKIIAEQGLFGLVTFGAFIIWILNTLWRRQRDVGYKDEARLAYFVSIFLVLSPLIFQLFNTQYYSSKMWVPIALGLAQSLLDKRQTKIFKFNFLNGRKKIKTDI